jgi:hypothetical protein
MTVPDKTAEQWRCWNLDCLSFNMLEDSLCWSCGNSKGYLDPELEWIAVEARLDEVKQALQCFDDIGESYDENHDTAYMYLEGRLEQLQQQLDLN